MTVLMRRLPLLLLPFVITGCTMIGVGNPWVRRTVDFGPEKRVPICIARDDNVSSAHANRLLDDWNRRDGRVYGLYFDVLSEEVIPRTSWSTVGLLNDARRSTQEECDYLVYFAGWAPVDTLYGLVGLGLGFFGVPTPETLGVASGGTVAVLAHLATPVDLVMEILSKLRRPTELVNPRLDTGRKDVTVHELYHVLGCGHALVKSRACYESIRRFKNDQR